MKSIAHELTVLVDKSKPFRSLLVKAEVGGSVELQYELDGERITAQTFTATGHYELVILRSGYLVPNNTLFSLV